MKNWLLILLFTCACFITQAQVNYITTIAGKAGVPASYSGDGGPATNARFYGPYSLCLDKTGNIYVADAYNCKIRKVAISTGIITKIAGIDTGGYNGDGIQATDAELALPEAIKTDTSGNLYIADGGNNRIRKITVSTGIISTIAGNGAFGDSGDNSPATTAELDAPSDLCFDKNGNIYISDYSNNRVRKIDTSGIITAFAGNGGFAYTGDGMPATDATFNGPLGLCADNSGNIYIADQYNHAIRKVGATTGIITTIAGTGTAGHTGDSGIAIHAQLNQPTGLLIDQQNNIYIAEFGDGVVRRIDAVTGIITTVAGDGTWGWAGDGGPATAAELSCTDLAFDNQGSMIIADYGTNTIRKVYNPKLGVNNATMRQYDNVVIYPNPASDEFAIEYNFTNNEDAILQLTDVMGRLVITKELSSLKQKEVIDISGFTQGLYLYKVVQNNLLISAGKIVKE